MTQKKKAKTLKEHKQSIKNLCLTLEKVKKKHERATSHIEELLNETDVLEKVSNSALEGLAKANKEIEKNDFIRDIELAHTTEIIKRLQS